MKSNGLRPSAVKLPRSRRLRRHRAPNAPCPVRLIEAMTEADTDPGRREFLEALPDGFGLVE